MKKRRSHEEVVPHTILKKMFLPLSGHEGVMQLPALPFSVLPKLKSWHTPPGGRERLLY